MCFPPNPAPWVPTVPTKTRLESRICDKEVKLHFPYDYTIWLRMSVAKARPLSYHAPLATMYPQQTHVRAYVIIRILWLQLSATKTCPLVSTARPVGNSNLKPAAGLIQGVKGYPGLKPEASSRVDSRELKVLRRTLSAYQPISLSTYQPDTIRLSAAPTNGAYAVLKHPLTPNLDA